MRKLGARPLYSPFGPSVCKICLKRPDMVICWLPSTAAVKIQTKRVTHNARNKMVRNK